MNNRKVASKQIKVYVKVNKSLSPFFGCRRNDTAGRQQPHLCGMERQTKVNKSLSVLKFYTLSLVKSNKNISSQIYFKKYISHLLIFFFFLTYLNFFKQQFLLTNCINNWLSISLYFFMNQLVDSKKTPFFLILKHIGLYI